MVFSRSTGNRTRGPFYTVGLAPSVSGQKLTLCKNAIVQRRYLKPGFHIIVSDVGIVFCHGTFCQSNWTIKPGLHTLVSNVRIIFVAECFVKRSGQSYGNSLVIVSNDPNVRSESFVPFYRPCVPIAWLKNSVTATILMLEMIIWKPDINLQNI